ncbi:MAG: chorismate mutase [Lentisphaeria bacterium]
MKDLLECRKMIDEIDQKIVSLICERMAVTADIAVYKKAHDLPVLNRAREEDMLIRLNKKAGPAFGLYVQELYEKIFAVSRAYQEKLNPDI